MPRKPGNHSHSALNDLDIFHELACSHGKPFISTVHCSLIGLSTIMANVHSHGNQIYFTSNILFFCLLNVLLCHFCIYNSDMELHRKLTDLLYLREKRCWSLVASGLYQAEASVSTAVKRKRRAAVTFRHKQLIKRTSVLILWLTKPIPAMSVGHFRKNNSITLVRIISKNITDKYFISNGKIVVYNHENMHNVKQTFQTWSTPNLPL